MMRLHCTIVTECMSGYNHLYSFGHVLESGRRPVEKVLHTTVTDLSSLPCSLTLRPATYCLLAYWQAASTSCQG